MLRSACLITLIAQYPYNLYPSQQLSCNIVLLFNLYNKVKFLTFTNKNGRPDMVTRKASNEKSI